MAELALRAQDLVKSYGRGPAAVAALRKADLEVRAGEFVAVLGPSGSGKSTLLHVLGLMDHADSGRLEIAGMDAAKSDEAARARMRGQKIGFVFQFDSLLPEFTILENVMMPARIAAAQGLSSENQASVQRRAQDLLSSLGIAPLSARFPAQTSGGERQRAALARALINQPALILADEPTGNLDAENGRKVFDDLQRMARERGAAVILVTHDEPASRAADRVLRMEAGVLRTSTGKGGIW